MVNRHNATIQAIGFLLVQVIDTKPQFIAIAYVIFSSSFPLSLLSSHSVVLFPLSVPQITNINSSIPQLKLHFSHFVLAIVRH